MHSVIALLLFFAAFAHADVISLLPVLHGSDWIVEFAPETYTPDNLHEYINGEAELYKKYDMVGMATASYRHKNNPNLTFTVDIYDMGTALNAFGIYSYYRRPDMTFADIGEQAIISEVSVRFWKGQYFVNMVGGAVDTSIAKALPQWAATIADGITALPHPEELSLLDFENQIPNSLTYKRDGLLSNILIADFIEAQYKNEEETWTEFVIFSTNDRIIGELISNLQIIFKKKKARLFGIYGFSNKHNAQKHLKEY